MSGSPARVWTAVFAAIVLGLAGAVLFYLDVDRFSRDNPDAYKIEEQHRRLAGIVEALPPDAVAGYLSDVPFTKPEGQVYFFGVQYAIAPRLLVEETPQRRQRWVIGSFLRRPDIQALEKEHGIKLVKSYGMGVYLFQREP